MNELKKQKQFEVLLANYHPHLDIFNSHYRLVILVSVTGGGRNTIIKELLKTNKYHYLVSDTTRKPRINLGIGEVNGREYWFKSEEEFIEGLEKGQYLEAAIIHNQQVSGINISEIENAIQDDKIPITDIEIEGAKSLLKKTIGLTAIFLLPPSFKQWMNRLDNRGSLEIDEKKRRLNSALNELEYALESDSFFFIANDELGKTTDLVDQYIHQGDPSICNQEVIRKKAQKLLKELKAYLLN